MLKGERCTERLGESQGKQHHGQNNAVHGVSAPRGEAQQDRDGPIEKTVLGGLHFILSSH